MKQPIRIFLIVLFLLPALACATVNISTNSNTVRGSGKIVTQEIDVSDFDSVSLEASGNVFIEQGQTESLTVEADDNIQPLLENKVRGSELVLSTKPNQGIDPSRRIIYRITVKDLKGISLKGSGNFSISPLTSESMNISLPGSGDINIEDLETGELSIDLFGSGNISIDHLTATSIDTSARGSGDIKLAGQADSQNISYSGSGNYVAGDLETNTANVNIPGSSDVTVWVNDTLKTDIDGSGTVRYYGSPTVDQTGNGSGKLNSLGEK